MHLMINALLCNDNKQEKIFHVFTIDFLQLSLSVSRKYFFISARRERKSIQIYNSELSGD
jgi:hypothetical protein